MVSDFLERLQKDVLIGYMPMQTFLVDEYGKPMEQHLSEWVLDHPEEFKNAIRRSYEAGCDMTHTATQASSVLRTSPFGQALVDRLFELNYKSARLAREVTPEGYYVIGNVSHSNPDFLEPLGSYTYDEVYQGYKVQILGLAEGGVDAFHISGNHIEEGIIAIKVAKDLTDIPVIGHNVYYPTKQGFRSMMGLDPKASSTRLQEAGAEVVGSNCGLMTKSLDMKDWYTAATELVKEIRKGTDRPISFQPDAGLAQLVGGKTVYPALPEDMASEVLKWVSAGARMVGGCCGASLEHCRRISAVIKGTKV